MRLRLNLGPYTILRMSSATPTETARPALGAPGFVCTCLQITERELLGTLSHPNVRTLRDIRRAIGAGDGCTVCHPVLQRYLDAGGQRSCPPICSAR